MHVAPPESSGCEAGKAPIATVRKDVARNRERIVRAAAAVFRRDGVLQIGAHAGQSPSKTNVAGPAMRTGLVVRLVGELLYVRA